VKHTQVVVAELHNQVLMKEGVMDYDRSTVEVAVLDMRIALGTHPA